MLNNMVNPDKCQGFFVFMGITLWYKPIKQKL